MSKLKDRLKKLGCAPVLALALGMVYLVFSLVLGGVSVARYALTYGQSLPQPRMLIVERVAVRYPPGAAARYAVIGHFGEDPELKFRMEIDPGALAEYRTLGLVKEAPQPGHHLPVRRHTLKQRAFPLRTLEKARHGHQIDTFSAAVWAVAGVTVLIVSVGGYRRLHRFLHHSNTSR